jgi:PAS domain S-box-containing protein
MAQTQTVTSKGQVKILIVEDEGLIAMDLGRRLAHLGYGVAGVASSGRQAMDLAARELPDIVLMDIRIEGEIDGIETARRIRHRFGLPVIYITSYADEMTLGRAKQTEPLGYIIKPFTDRALYSSIEMALHRHMTETGLRRHEGWLDALLHSIGDAVAATDEQGRIRLMNRAATRITGWPETEALGRLFHEVVNLSEFDSRQPVDPIEDVLYSRNTIPAVRFYLQSRDGHEAIVEHSTATVVQDDAIRGGVFVFRDITDRVRIEEELQESRRRESLTRLAHGVADDFKSLFAVILGISWGD